VSGKREIKDERDIQIREVPATIRKGHAVQRSRPQVGRRGNKYVNMYSTLKEGEERQTEVN
jgi:hypothetical protein